MAVIKWKRMLTIALKYIVIMLSLILFISAVFCLLDPSYPKRVLSVAFSWTIWGPIILGLVLIELILLFDFFGKVPSLIMTFGILMICFSIKGTSDLWNPSTLFSDVSLFGVGVSVFSLAIVLFDESQGTPDELRKIKASLNKIGENVTELEKTEVTLRQRINELRAKLDKWLSVSE